MPLPIKEQDQVEVGDSTWVELLPPDPLRTIFRAINGKTANGNASESTVFTLWAKEKPADSVVALTGFPLEPGHLMGSSPSITSGLYARAKTGGVAFVNFEAA